MGLRVEIRMKERNQRLAVKRPGPSGPIKLINTNEGGGAGVRDVLLSGRHAAHRPHLPPEWHQVLRRRRLRLPRLRLRRPGGARLRGVRFLGPKSPILGIETAFYFFMAR